MVYLINLFFEKKFKHALFHFSHKITCSQAITHLQRKNLAWLMMYDTSWNVKTHQIFKKLKNSFFQHCNQYISLRPRAHSCCYILVQEQPR